MSAGDEGRHHLFDLAESVAELDLQIAALPAILTGAMKFAYEDAILWTLAVVALVVGIVATICWRNDLFRGWRNAPLWGKALLVAHTPLMMVWNGFVITYHVIVYAVFFIVLYPPALLINFLFPSKPRPPRLPEKYVPPAQKRTLRHPFEFTVEARRIAKKRVLKNMKEKGINPYRVRPGEIDAATTAMLKVDWKSIRADAEMSFHENEILAKMRTIDEYGSAPPSGWRS